MNNTTVTITNINKDNYYKVYSILYDLKEQLPDLNICITKEYEDGNSSFIL